MSFIKPISEVSFSSTDFYITSRGKLDEQSVLRVGENSPHALARLNQISTFQLA
jgi:hypothetical protein